jgi:hypothetical protein
MARGRRTAHDYGGAYTHHHDAHSSRAPIRGPNAVGACAQGLAHGSGLSGWPTQRHGGSAAAFKGGIETVPRSAPPWLMPTGARSRAAPGFGLGGFSEDTNIFGLCDF